MREAYRDPLQQMQTLRNGVGYQFFTSEGGQSTMSVSAPGLSWVQRPGFLEGVGAGHRAPYSEQLCALVRYRACLDWEENASESDADSLESDFHFMFSFFSI